MALNPIQAVVIALISLLPALVYHIFLDNLFTSPNLFLIIRLLGHGATGTARKNSGIFVSFVTAKGEDVKGKSGFKFNELQAVPTPDNQVNQIAWKDNALVLFLSTVFTGLEMQLQERKKPTSMTPASKEVRAFFGPDYVKEFEIPQITVQYNHEMNGVDRGDQLKEGLGYDHSFYRGGWHAIAWSFLLDTILVNSYLLQQRGQPAWKPFTTQVGWRNQLVDEITTAYSTIARSREKYRMGDTITPPSQHKHINRKKSSRCLGCQGIRFNDIRSQSKQKRALKEVKEVELNSRDTARKTRLGCDRCDVAICSRKRCWYFYHRLIPQ